MPVTNPVVMQLPPEDAAPTCPETVLVASVVTAVKMSVFGGTTITVVLPLGTAMSGLKVPVPIDSRFAAVDPILITPQLPPLAVSLTVKAPIVTDSDAFPLSTALKFVPAEGPVGPCGPVAPG